MKLIRHLIAAAAFLAAAPVFAHGDTFEHQSAAGATAVETSPVGAHFPESFSLAQTFQLAGIESTQAVLNIVSSFYSGASAVGQCSNSTACLWQRLEVSFGEALQPISGSGEFRDFGDAGAVSPVPEPGAYAMLALGVAGLMFTVRRQRNKRA